VVRERQGSRSVSDQSMTAALTNAYAANSTIPSVSKRVGKPLTIDWPIRALALFESSLIHVSLHSSQMTSRVIRRPLVLYSRRRTRLFPNSVTMLGRRSGLPPSRLSQLSHKCSARFVVREFGQRCTVSRRRAYQIVVSEVYCCPRPRLSWILVLEILA
jgi:hypothetical protein